MEKTYKNQRRRPVQKRSIEKYNAILDASTQVLNKLGYQKTTMSEISLESGHPYATIYQYFANKDDIFMAWLERFIDSSLFELSRLMSAKPSADIDYYIGISVQYALEETIRNQQTLTELFGNMPLVTTRLVELMEQRALNWLQQAFKVEVSENSNSRPVQNLLTAVRAGNGYWLQLTLNTRRTIDVDEESKNFSALVKALLAIK